MDKYPTQLFDKVEPLPPEVPQNRLGDHGLHVVQGLTEDLANQLVVRSHEEAVAQFCGSDKDGRFSNLEAIETWQQKGRLALPLVKSVGDSSLKLMGMGWMGPGTPGKDGPAIPNAKTTFAIRLYEGATGQGNATPYTRAILAAHQSVMENNNGVWLEAWGDNTNAIAAYARVGFRQIARLQGNRHGEPKPRVYMVLDSLILR